MSSIANNKQARKYAKHRGWIWVGFLSFIVCGCSSPPVYTAENRESRLDEFMNRVTRKASAAYPAPASVSATSAADDSSFNSPSGPGPAESAAPAGPNDEASFSSQFQADFNRPDWQPRFQVLFDRAEELYYRSQSAVADYDKALDEAAAQNLSDADFKQTVIDNNSYPRLLALESFSQSTIHQIDYYYLQLTSIVKKEEAAQEPQRDIYVRAEDALAFMNRYLDQTPGASRVALNAVVREINDSLQEGHSELQPATERMFVNDNKALVEFMKQPDTAQELSNWSNRLSAKSTWVQRQSDGLATQIQTQLHAAVSTPASNQIEPGVGKNGLVTGYGYPANTWSLTFDDGPHPKYSALVIANLKAHAMHATFFEMAQNAIANPSVSKMIYGTPGMEIGSHSYTHPQLTKVSDVQLDKEVRIATDKIGEITGKRPLLYRLPYGDGLNNLRIRKALATNQLINVFWTVDTLDWQDHDPSSILARTKKQMQMSKNNRGIILFHDIHPQSVEASRMLMDDVKPVIAAGRERFVTVGALIDELNKGN
jgi:peptidoglycan/xylan/chitin deacetylase (PgdA/CDA1 family)